MWTSKFLMLATGTMMFAVADVVARPYGAPSTACRSMRPRHGVEQDSTEEAFIITQSDVNFKEGYPVTVNLTALTERRFRGFLIKAVVGGKAAGDFVELDDSQPVVGCKGFATHTYPNFKSGVALQWNPPSGTGAVTFV
ncbi:putative defense protein Hdd11-like [Amblyomma americanum]